MKKFLVIGVLGTGIWSVVLLTEAAVAVQMGRITNNSSQPATVTMTFEGRKKREVAVTVPAGQSSLVNEALFTAKHIKVNDVSVVARPNSTLSIHNEGSAPASVSVETAAYNTSMTVNNGGSWTVDRGLPVVEKLVIDKVSISRTTN